MPMSAAQERKVVIVTGGNHGIGYEACLCLAQQPEYIVIVASRSPERTQAAVDKIGQLAGHDNVVSGELDLASLDSVKRFSEWFKANYQRLDALICNAGVMNTALRYSKDRFEETIAVNHVGHYLLTRLLLDDLLRSGSVETPSRVVIISSATHDPARNIPAPPPNFTLLELLLFRPEGGAKEEVFNGSRAYTNSKLCNLLFGYELVRRLDASGEAGLVAVNMLEPGFIPTTNLARSSPAIVRYILPTFGWIYGKLKSNVTSSADKAGAFIAQLATSEEHRKTTGQYFHIDHVAKSSEASYDVQLAKGLWEDTEKLVSKWL